MAEEFYRLVGSNIRARRAAMEWTLERMANRLGVSYQQVQKYEKGANRLPAHMLVELSHEFGCSIDDLCGHGATAISPDLLRLNKTLQDVTSESVRRRLLSFVEAALELVDLPGGSAFDPSR